MMVQKTQSIVPKKSEPKPDDGERIAPLTSLRSDLSDAQVRSFKGADNNWDPRQSKKGKLMLFSDRKQSKLPTLQSKISGVQDQRKDGVPSRMETNSSPLEEEEDEEPSLTSLRTGLSDCSFGAANDWDPRKSKKGMLMQFSDRKQSKMPSLQAKLSGVHDPREYTTAPLEEEEDVVDSLRSELSDAPACSLNVGDADWDPQQSKKGEVMQFSDRKQSRIPSLQAKLTGVYNPNSESNPSFPSSGPKKAMSALPGGLRPKKSASLMPGNHGPKKALSLAPGRIAEEEEEEDVVDSLRSELSDAPARSLNVSDADWDPRQSKKGKLMLFSDRKQSKLPTLQSKISGVHDPNSRPEYNTAPPEDEEEDEEDVVDSLRSELSDAPARSLNVGDADWDPRQSKKGKLMLFSDRKQSKLPTLQSKISGVHDPNNRPKYNTAPPEDEEEDEEDVVDSLRSELSETPARALHVGDADWDPRQSKKGMLMQFSDRKQSKIPTLQSKLSGVHNPNSKSNTSSGPKKAMSALPGGLRPKKAPSLMPGNQSPKKALSLAPGRIAEEAPSLSPRRPKKGMSLLPGQASPKKASSIVPKQLLSQKASSLSPGGNHPTKALSRLPGLLDKKLPLLEDDEDE